MYANCHHNIPFSSRDRAIFTFGKASSDEKCHFTISWARSEMSMFTQKFFKLFNSVQEMVSFSLFQNLALSRASTDDKCHFAIVSPFAEPRQIHNQFQMSFDNLMVYTLLISMCLQNFITIFHSIQEIGPFSLFQNLELDKALADEKCHFAISWARSCQYQCLRKSFSKYSTQFKR